MFKKCQRPPSRTRGVRRPSPRLELCATQPAPHVLAVVHDGHVAEDLRHDVVHVELLPASGSRPQIGEPFLLRQEIAVGVDDCEVVGATEPRGLIDSTSARTCLANRGYAMKPMTLATIQKPGPVMSPLVRLPFSLGLLVTADSRFPRLVALG